MDSNGNLTYYLPAQLSQPSTPNVSLLNQPQTKTPTMSFTLPTLPNFDTIGKVGNLISNAGSTTSTAASTASTTAGLSSFATPATIIPAGLTAMNYVADKLLGNRGPAADIGGYLFGLPGNIIGGFFKKKKPNPASLFLGKTGGDTGISNASYGSKHMDNSFAQGLEGDFASYVKTLQNNYGIDIGGQDVFGGSDKGRTFIRTIDLSKPYSNPYGYAEDSIFDFDPNDPESKQKAYNSLAVDILKRKNMYTPELEKQINEVGTVAGAKKTIEAQNIANGRSAEGIPMVAAKKDSKALSFAEYTAQHNQGRWS